MYTDQHICLLGRMSFAKAKIKKSAEIINCNDNYIKIIAEKQEQHFNFNSYY